MNWLKAGWFLTGLLGACWISWCIAAIWLGSPRMGSVAIFTAVFLVAPAFLAMVFHADQSKHNSPLSKEAKRALKEHRERILLAEETRKMEIKAGLRDSGGRWIE